MSARCEAAVSPERAGAPGARSRLAAVLAVIALLGAALWLVPRAAGAVRAGATISGTVTRGDKSGIAGIEVTAYPEGSPRPLPAVFTAADGTYILTGLAAGSYKLRFFDPGGRFVAEFYDNRPSLSAADPVAVEAGAVVTGIDARLASFGSLGGVVKNAAGKPLAGIEVNAWTADGFDGWQWGGSAATGANGRYTINGLQPGNYRVGFADPKGIYLAEYYDNARALPQATDIAVQPSRITINVDAALDLPGGILGTVRDAAGRGVGGVRVTVLLSEGDGRWSPVGSAVTTGSGAYMVKDLPAGVCRVRFVDPEERYLSVFYRRKAGVPGAANVVVAPGRTVEGVDALLVRAARIRGRVMRADGAALSGVRVYALRRVAAGWRPAGSAISDSGGAYAIGSLAAGRYRVKFSDDSGVFVTEYWKHALLPEEAKVVHLQTGADMRAINARLAAAGRLAGTVQRADGAPLARITVTVFRRAGSDWVWGGTAATGKVGTYRLGGLAAGVYRVCFSDPAGRYQTLYFRAAASLAAAADVRVTSAHTTWRIGATLRLKR